MEKIFGFCFFVALAGCVATPALKEDGLKKAMTPIRIAVKMTVLAILTVVEGIWYFMANLGAWCGAGR